VILVVDGEIRPKVSGQWHLNFAQLPPGQSIHDLTGRRKSRSHQIAWLVIVGEVPKTSIGSERMRHSQIDQRWGIAALNTVSGGSCSGGEAASTCTKIW